MITLLNRKWPDTGRQCPEGAELKTIVMHQKWIDLVYWSTRPAPRDGWIYLSTLPNIPLDNTENNVKLTV